MRLFLSIIFFSFVYFPGHSYACLKIGLLGEFKRPTGSTKQPFGDEIKNGAELAVKYLSANNNKKNKCLEYEIIDIEQFSC